MTISDTTRDAIESWARREAIAAAATPPFLARALLNDILRRREWGECAWTARDVYQPPKRLYDPAASVDQGVDLDSAFVTAGRARLLLDLD